MKEEILGLEKDFANNNYYGTNVWTDEKFRVLSGNIPVILSAPHAVNQLREDNIRDAEKYTGSLVRYISSSTSSYAIFQLFTASDPNYDVNHNYKSAIVNLVEANDIKFLIDLHSNKMNDSYDIDIATNNGATLMKREDLVQKLIALGEKYNLKIVENVVATANKEEEIINVVSKLCGIPCIQLVINEKLLETESNEENFQDVVNIIEEIITYFSHA
ncbi:MAG: hypothetical protein RSA10_02665 [Bacilli bacterium]